MKFIHFLKYIREKYKKEHNNNKSSSVDMYIYEIKEAKSTSKKIIEQNIR